MVIETLKSTPQNEFRRRRRSLDLTQQDVADALRCAKMAVSYVERGEVTRGRVIRDYAALLMRVDAEREEQ